MHPPVRYNFGDFALDVAERSLTRGNPPAGEDLSAASPVRVPLQPKTFDLLVHLVTHAGRLHTKQALLDEVWGDVVVTENSLTQSIHQLRSALDDTAQEPRFVETVPRAGYRFIAAVTQHALPTPAGLHDAAESVAAPAAQKLSYRRFGFVIVALLGVAVAYFVAAKFWLPQSPPPAQIMPSVAVLPFKNLGNDPANEAFADGIPDTLLTMLAQIRELRVIGRTSSFSFRDKEIDVRTIGAALGADAVLEGSVQRSGERLRINAQLISGLDGVHLWAENFERPNADIFAVQDEIAQRVAEALKITLAGKIGPGSAGTQNFEAYQLALEAKHLMGSRQSVNLAKALAKLERAVQLDPNYGEAWVLLSGAYLHDSATHDAALRAAQRALEVAPQTAGSHLAMGYVLTLTGGDGAAEAMARGLELDPQNPIALAMVAAEYRLRAGRYAEAAALMQRALKLDPRSANAHLGAAFAFEANGDLPGALTQIREVLRLDPDMGQAYDVAGRMLYGTPGRMDDALRFIRRARLLEPTQPSPELVIGYALLGEDEQAAHELAAERSILEPETLPILRAQVDLLAGRDAAPRELINSALTTDPPPRDLLVAIDELGLAPDEHEAQRALDRLRTIDPDWVEHARQHERYPLICILAWSGDRANAESLLGHWQQHWLSHLPYSSGTGDQNVGTAFARALACTGRNEEAPAELERLVAKGYHAGGWRGLAADHAYDAIREDPRFVALLDRLRTITDAERQRFLARPDLVDADIDALVGTPAL